MSFDPSALGLEPKEVRARTVQSDEGFLLLVELREGAEQLNLGQWAALHRQRLQALVAEYGVVFLRGFAREVEDFKKLVFPLSNREQLHNYVGGTSPRKRFDDDLYDSTTFPRKSIIPQHNELSYLSDCSPRFIYFYCDVPAEVGGETPICSNRLFGERLDPAIFARFQRKGVRYVRNYWLLGPSWQECFGTTDQRAVESLCRGRGLHSEWLPGNRLRTTNVVAATRTSDSGETLWFNQANTLNIHSGVRGQMSSTMELIAPGIPPDLTDRIVHMDPMDAPYVTFYGDGTPIEKTVIDEINAVYETGQVALRWRKGDVMLIDNHAATHGRNGFEGERRTLTMLADPNPN
jgi:hypothetical protein